MSANFRINLNGGETMRIKMISPSSAAFSGRISINTTAGWNEKISYVPVKGEIVIYSDRHVIDGVDHPGIKIGDGLAYVVDLPFFGDDEADRIITIIDNHITDASVHVSEEDRSFWNAKLNYETVGENLIFTRN